MGKADLQVNFRMPAELKAGLEDSAEANARSLTAEIVHRLRESLDGKAIVLPDQFRARLVADAKKHGWPLESELLHTLADALEPPEPLTPLATLQELEQRIAELRRENEHLRAMAEMRDRTIDVVLGGQDLLANYVVGLHAHLPAKLKADPNMQIPLRFAQALLERDGPEMASALGDLFADDKSVVHAMRQLRNELVHAPPPTRAKAHAAQGADVEIPAFLRKQAPAQPKPHAKKRGAAK
jgi:hypothetical protein